LEFAAKIRTQLKFEAELKDALEREHLVESTAENLISKVMSRRRFWVLSIVCVLSATTLLAGVTTVISNRRSHKDTFQLDTNDESFARQLERTQNRLDRLENEDRIAETIVHTYGPSVCFLHVLVGFRDKDSGQLIRIDADATGKAHLDDKGMVSLDTDGTGPPLQVDFFGTGFLVTSDGRLLTNHHVAEPWASDMELTHILDLDAAAFVVSYTAYFPGTSQGIVAKLDRISHHADLATLKLQTPAPPHTALLELDDRSEASVSGDPVVLIGYPTGIEGILARAGSDVTRKVAESAQGVTQILSHMAAQHLIRPTTTQGHIGDVLTDKIVYDAATTSGGSGGPLFNRDGKVIGVSSAILKDFGGSNLAVPVRYADELLK
jgi:S1-C subfamily serine protease